MEEVYLNDMTEKVTFSVKQCTYEKKMKKKLNEYEKLMSLNPGKCAFDKQERENTTLHE